MKKADSVNRTIAKVIDFLIVGLLCIVPAPVGFLAAALYILISDGFWGGRSVGKKLIGLHVLVRGSGGESRPPAFRDSIIRNLLYAAVILLGSIPIVGWFFLFPLGLVLIGLEAYFVYVDDHGIRIGDIFAQTQVVDDAPANA